MIEKLLSPPPPFPLEFVSLNPTKKMTDLALKKKRMNISYLLPPLKSSDSGLKAEFPVGILGGRLGNRACP